jgi:probable HAF family extracellular repeat protein
VRSRLYVEPLEERWCPASYTITDLGTLGGATSGATAINNAGQVAGGANTAAGVNHAFLWTPGATSGVPTNPQMQDLGTLPGFLNSQAWALNNAGQVAGQVSEASGANADAFYWNGTALQDLGTLGGTRTIAWALNNAVPGGHPVQVVGESWTGALNPNGFPIDHAFLWQNGVMTDLNNQLPANSGWVLTVARGINDNQQVVGRGTHNGQLASWLWQIGSSVEPTDLSVGTSTGGNSPSAVNNAGQVAGDSEATFPYRAFLWTNGSTILLPALRGTRSDTSDEALALNNASPLQVVGQTLNDVGPIDVHALLWQNSNVTDLIKQIPASAGWSQLSAATGVNDAGQIVGRGTLASGAGHAFLMTPSHGGKTQAAVSTTTATVSPAGPESPFHIVSSVDGRTTVQFGDGIHGATPSTGEGITPRYGYGALDYAAVAAVLGENNGLSDLPDDAVMEFLKDLLTNPRHR